MTDDLDELEECPKRFQSPMDALTYAIIGAAQKVHSTLGPGFTENIYQAAMVRELMNRGIPFDAQKDIEIFYEGVLCGTYRPDLLVYGEVIVELKAVASTCKEHRVQTKSYMKASGLSAGLLLNFGAVSLDVQRFNNDKTA
ncbi:MAG: GxxExxY protein [Planctomycetaceae bacterium]|nr:MAG: GxxExxY protein [Planctomycetaceae bacterium]